MAHALKASVSFDDYLAMEDAGTQRREYVAGQVYAMTGGSARHNRIAFNIARILADRLEGTPCQVFIGDVKLHVQAAGAVYYPDVFVQYGTAVATDIKVVDDATLVVEVLSLSTAGIDRREKLMAYRKLPALRAYWIVSQDEQRIEVHACGAEGAYEVTAYTLGDSIPAGWIGGSAISLAKIYAGTDIG